MLKSLASWQAGEQQRDSAVVPTEMKNQHRRKNTHRQTHSCRDSIFFFFTTKCLVSCFLRRMLEHNATFSCFAAIVTKLQKCVLYSKNKYVRHIVGVWIFQFRRKSQQCNKSYRKINTRHKIQFQVTRLEGTFIASKHYTCIKEHNQLLKKITYICFNELFFYKC